MLRRCLGTPERPCGQLVRAGTTRCALCRSAVERRRGTPTQRGYGADHQRARAELAMLLPAVCGGDLGAPYCGRWILAGERWVAAHRVDGKPEYGYVHAHGACNERAKRTAGGADRTGEHPAAVPAPSDAHTYNGVSDRGVVA